MQPARVAVVDDDRFVREMLEMGLSREGYVVRTASDGQGALDLVKSWDPEVIVLDIMMPKIDGITLLPRLRELSQAPILMLTAKGETSDKVASLGAGADDYLVKPFDLDELFARLRSIIRRSANKTTNVIEIGDVKIDTAARNVSLKDKPVELTAREYSLVEFLALHRGEVVTRTQLYEHLFDENESSLSNLLDVHVSNVRKKLGAEFITTRRGHGYCIG